MGSALATFSAATSLISRTEGFIFLFYYVAYTSYLILQATEHNALPIFNTVLLMFIIPITTVTVVMVILRRHGDRQLRAFQRSPTSR